MSDYLPDIKQIESRLGLTEDERLEDVKSIEVDGAFLRFLISKIAYSFAFDARAYREENDLCFNQIWEADISVSDHFSDIGYFAGLNANPRNFDEDWYLATYPEVRKDISDGLYKDALDHYVMQGRTRCHLPNARAEDEVRAWRKILRKKKKPDPIDLPKLEKTKQAGPS